MKQVQFLNDKGNVQPIVRASIKAQTIEFLKAKLGDRLVITPKGPALIVGEHTNGEPIYAVIAPTITMDIEVKEKAKTASKNPADVVVPNMFDAE